MGSRLVGLHLKSMRQRKSLPSSRKWLVLAGVGLPGSARSQMSKHQDTGEKNPKTGLYISMAGPLYLTHCEPSSALTFFPCFKI